jgi:hypothetical protein
VLSKETEECLDVYVPLEGEMERQVGLYRIDVAVAFFHEVDVPGLGQVGDNALRGTLGDVQQVGDLPDSDPRIAHDQQEGISVIGEESELWDPRHQLAPFSLAKAGIAIDKTGNKSPT